MRLSEETMASWQGYLMVLGGLLWMISVGTFYLFGNATPYIASYLTYYYHQINASKSSLSQQEQTYASYTTQLNYLYLAFIGTMTISIAVGSNIEVHLGPRKTMILSAILFLGYGLCYFSLSLSAIYPEYGLIFLIITYGIPYACGCGIGYGIPLVVVMRWFPNHKAIACGLINSAIGLGPLIFDNIQTWLINPNNIPLDAKLGYTQYPQIIHQIPNMFVYMNLMMILLQIIGFILIKSPNWYLSDVQLKKMATDGGNVSQSQFEYNRSSLTLKESMKTKLFWMLVLHHFFYLFLLTFMTTEWKVFAMNYLEITDDSFLALTGSINGFCNALGRLGWGILYQKVFNKSYRWTMIIQDGIITVMLFTLPLCRYSPYVMYFIWMLVLWFCIGGLFGFYPAALSLMYGAKYSGTLFGATCSIEALSALMFAVMSQNMYNWFGGWMVYCFVMGIVSILCVIITFLSNTKIDKEKYMKSRIIMKATVNYQSVESIDNKI